MLDAERQTLECKTNTKKPSHVSNLATRALLSRLANTPNMRTDIRYVTSYFVRKTTRQEALHMGICSFFTLSPDLSSPSSWQRSLSEGTVHFLDCASLFFLASLSSSSGNPEKLFSRQYHPFSQISSQISQSSQSSHLNGQVRQARRPAPLDFFFGNRLFGNNNNNRIEEKLLTQQEPWPQRRTISAQDTGDSGEKNVPGLVRIHREAEFSRAGGQGMRAGESGRQALWCTGTVRADAHVTREDVLEIMHATNFAYEDRVGSCCSSQKYILRTYLCTPEVC